MVEIVETRVQEIVPQATELFKEHREELATHKGIMRLNPNFAVYEKAEQEGSFFALGAYDGKELVGYSGSFLFMHLHYADLAVCQNDLLYVKNEYRNSSVGLKLIKKTEQSAIEKGARFMLWHVKPETTMHKLMPKLGGAVQDIIYSKELCHGGD